MQDINRVITGDCRRILTQLADRSVDFVLTDPPYLVNYRSRDGRSIAGDTNGAWLRPVTAELYRLLKPNRFFVSFYGWQAAEQFLSAWRGAGFRPVAHLAWPKRYTSSARYVRYQHEQAYVLAKGYPPLPAAPDFRRAAVEVHRQPAAPHPEAAGRPRAAHPGLLAPARPRA
jgi:DNA modification methylase